MNGITLKKVRRKHIINELFSITKLDKRLILKEWEDQGGDKKRWYYILSKQEVQLTVGEENFFSKIFEKESSLLYQNSDKQ